MLIRIIEVVACFIGGWLLFHISSIIDLLADFVDHMITAHQKRKCKNCGTMRRKPDQQFCPTCGNRLASADSSGAARR